jgi:hypothetical protein
MSGETWKLIDWFKDNKGRSKTKLAINSNLGMDSIKLQEFIEKVVDIPHLEIYTSMEATDGQAEYIRDGLDYSQWMHNVQELLEHDTIKAVHCMCTINALCLNSLDSLLDQLVKLKQVYGRERVSFTLNILRFPSFQSPLVLPEHLLLYYRNRLIKISMDTSLIADDLLTQMYHSTKKAAGQPGAPAAAGQPGAPAAAGAGGPTKQMPAIERP